MTARLNDKTALITGAAQGIGRAICLAFATEGARVIATDINTQTLATLPVADSINPCPLDVLDAAAIKDCAARFREVDILVNCAGVVFNGTLLECSEEDWQQSLNLNVTAMFKMITAFMPAMLDRQRGSIINIASVVSSIKGAPNRCAYGTSKAAVIGLTKSVARDYIEHGIRCNAICPGTVNSPSLEQRMRAGGDYEKARADFLARQPMGRIGEPEEIAAVATLLASDEATYMTGTEIVIDGGWSI